MAEEVAYQGGKDVKKLEQCLFDLKQIKDQVDRNDMPTQLAVRLYLTTRVIWGPSAELTQNYAKKINAISKVRPFMMATSLSGKEKKVKFDICSKYSKLIEEIIVDLKATISSLQDKIIQKLLSNNRRRVFFDIRKPENNVRLIGLIDNEYKRKTFTNGLEKILANYPKSVGQEEVRVKEILKYFANICGVSIPTQPGWFYYIAGDDGAIWSLTLRTESEEWYTFMASDSFISVERCLPTEKHIIGLWGSAGTGKTPTMHKVFRILQKNYSKHSVVFESHARYDVKGVFFIGNAKVGVEGQGDPNSRQQNSIAEFVSIGCDIIIIPSRTFGMTVDAINRFRGIYEINWEKRWVESNENLHEAINQAQAEDLVQKIEQYAVKY